MLVVSMAVPAAQQLRRRLLAADLHGHVNSCQAVRFLSWSSSSSCYCWLSSCHHRSRNLRRLVTQGENDSRLPSWLGTPHVRHIYQLACSSCLTSCQSLFGIRHGSQMSTNSSREQFSHLAKSLYKVPFPTILF